MKEYWFNRFLNLLVNYLGNANDDLIKQEMTNEECKAYIESAKNSISEVMYYFNVGAAWGVTLSTMITNKVEISLCDDFIDLVEEYTGITIP